MNYEEVVLIGGPNDGQRIRVLEGLPELRLPAKQDLPPYSLEYASQPVDSSLTQYRRFSVQSHLGYNATVYVHGGVDPLLALIEGYRKP